MKKNFSLSQNSSEKFFSLAIYGLLFVGVLFRVRHFFIERSLWLDEAMLALGILDLSFWELTQQPLPYQQGAPIGFLFFVKATTLFLGSSEYAFRLYSFGAGLAALFLLAFLARHYLEKAGALFTLALFASNPYLIYYSSETKQYMGDVAITALVLYLLYWQLKDEFNIRKGVFFTFINLFVLWFSHPSAFSVAATGAVLFLHYWREGEKKALLFAGVNLALSGINAGLLYWFHIRPLSENDFLRSFWEEVFMPIPPTLEWFGKMWEGILNNPFGLKVFYFGFFLLFLSGIFFLWKKNRQFTLALVFILLGVFAAGALQKYPLAERMMLFSTPVFFLLFGAGIDALYNLIKEKRLSFILITLLAIYLLYAPFGRSFERLRQPFYREHIRPTLSYLKENFQDGDMLYLYYFAEPAFLFYQPKFDLEEINYFSGGEHQENPDAYIEEFNGLEGRVWLLFTHVYEVAHINEENFIIGHLEQKAKKARVHRLPGTSVSLYLFEFP